MLFINIVSQSIIFIFILLTGLLQRSVLNFDEVKFISLSNLSVFPFVKRAFSIKSKNSSPSPRCQRFSHVFFPKLYTSTFDL